MIEDLILNIHLLLFLFDGFHDLFVVAVVEVFELGVLDDAVLVGVDLLEEAEEVLSLEGDAVDLRHHRLHVTHRQEAHTAVHASEGVLSRGYHLEFLLNGAEHLSTLDLLSEAHVLLLSGAGRAQHGATAGCGLPLLVLEHIIIGVCGPELLQELLLSDIAFLFLVESREENLKLLVGEVRDLEPDQCLSQLLQRHGGRFVLINKVEALVNGNIVLSQVFTDLPEYPPLPLDSELFLYMINQS